MTLFQLSAILLTLAAAGGYINHKYMRLPATIGCMAFALIASSLAIALDKAGYVRLEQVSNFVRQIDFSEVLLHGMLSFLLFAGALHIHIDTLRNVRSAVFVLATAGVIIATFVTGSLIWLAAHSLGLTLPYIYALLFGALISPTDPIAVLAMLKEAGISKTLYVKIGAESLFNDGIGVVVFLTILNVTTGTTPASVESVVTLLLREAVGGALLGALLGWGTCRLLLSIDDYKVEMLLTLSLVTGGYALADAVHVSAPIFMVVAGLIVGNLGRLHAMSDDTRERLDVFWELVDETLNAVLFMLIGLEIIVITITSSHLWLGIPAIAAVLAGRFMGVAIPIGLMSLRKNFERGTIRMLTWGGLRGGLSIAMALSLPEGPEKDLFIPVTYIVVLFSILVQGLTFPKLVQALIKPSGKA